MGEEGQEATTQGSGSGLRLVCGHSPLGLAKWPMNANRSRLDLPALPPCRPDIPRPFWHLGGWAVVGRSRKSPSAHF